MNNTAIKVENLGKKYVIRHETGNGDDNFREVVVGGAKKIITSLNPFSKTSKNDEDSTTEDFWALNDVNFEIKKGDKVGIIGRNGAGKSTLLKVLSRITEPTTGKIHINGRIASLLEVGTGFHPELTGRENIYLNGAILGMSRKEIKSKFDEIVTFAEVEKFLDTPVKRYSSGMYVRLAFSVAAHLEPEILVVDEVLAVGDVEFQKKCLGKMGEVSKEGRTILFVSHNMAAIASLCNKTMLMERGQISYQGDSPEAIKRYMNPTHQHEFTPNSFQGPLKNDILFHSIAINGEEGIGVTIHPADELVFEVRGVSKKRLDSFRMALMLYKDNMRVLTTRDVLPNVALEEGEFIFTVKIPPYLLRPGLYTIAIGGRKEMHSDWINGTELCDFFIKEEWSLENEQENEGVINVPFNGERRMKSNVN